VGGSFAALPPRMRAAYRDEYMLERITENLGAADVDLTHEEFERIEAELAKIEIHGNRTDEDIARLRDLG